MQCWGAVLAGLVALGAASPAAANPGDAQPGYSLADDWGHWWRRIFDRNGRPDPVGPIQQRYPVLLYHEYGTDKAVADFPLMFERDWEERTSGARFWIHSFDATQLANQVQLKMETPMSDTWTFGLEFNRLKTRAYDSQLLRMDIDWEPTGETGPYLKLSFFPRFVKQDSDAQATFGYRSAWGEARLRVIDLDAYANGTYALASGRAEPPDGLAQQLSLPLGLAAEFESAPLHGVRTELYVGGVIPHKTAYYFDDAKDRRVQRLSAQLAGALVEWKHASMPLWVGASGLSVATQWDMSHPLEPERDRHIDEETHQARLYAMAAPRSDLKLEAQARYSSRPEREIGAAVPEEGRRRTEHEWVYSARAFWMLSDTAGMDLSIWRIHRDTEGLPDVDLEGKSSRFVTRALLQLGEVWASFGIGWDLDPNRSIYAGGGGTLIIHF